MPSTCSVKSLPLQESNRKKVSVQEERSMRSKLRLRALKRIMDRRKRLSHLDDSSDSIDSESNMSATTIANYNGTWFNRALNKQRRPPRPTLSSIIDSSTRIRATLRHAEAGTTRLVLNTNTADSSSMNGSKSTSLALTATLASLGSIVLVLLVLIAYFGYFR